MNGSNGFLIGSKAISLAGVLVGFSLVLVFAGPAPGAGKDNIPVILCQVHSLEGSSVVIEDTQPAEDPQNTPDQETPGDQLNGPASGVSLEQAETIYPFPSDVQTDFPDLDTMVPMMQKLLEQGDFLKVLGSDAFQDFVDFEKLQRQMQDGSLQDMAKEGRLEEIFDAGAMDKLLGDENFQKLITSPQFQHIINNFSTMDMNQEIDLESMREGELGSYLDSVMGDEGDIDPDLMETVIERFETMEELLQE